jgi:hypothetical protein
MGNDRPVIAHEIKGKTHPERRDRLLVASAGVAPHLDGLSLLACVDAYGSGITCLLMGLWELCSSLSV